jgi:hypothetical protein
MIITEEAPWMGWMEYIYVGLGWNVLIDSSVVYSVCMSIKSAAPSLQPGSKLLQPICPCCPLCLFCPLIVLFVLSMSST